MTTRANKSDSIARLDREVVRCRACPRLVAWREEVGRTRRAAFRDEVYWSRPVPAFGGADARLLVLGLAPGAHGANRTGRPFTGDGAGPFLYGALHRAGFSSGPESVARDDGLELRRARITNAVRCVPPANQPAAEETERCFPFLEREVDLLADLRVVLALGGIAWKQALRLYRARGHTPPRPQPKFGHGAEWRPEGGPALLGCFHPSQLNTHTGRLTAEMIDAVLERARELCKSRRSR